VWVLCGLGARCTCVRVCCSLASITAGTVVGAITVVCTCVRVCCSLASITAGTVVGTITVVVLLTAIVITRHRSRNLKSRGLSGTAASPPSRHPSISTSVQTTAGTIQGAGNPWVTTVSTVESPRGTLPAVSEGAPAGASRRARKARNLARKGNNLKRPTQQRHMGGTHWQPEAMLPGSPAPGLVANASAASHTGRGLVVTDGSIKISA
jgi:hypothetical protein